MANATPSSPALLLLLLLLSAAAAASDSGLGVSFGSTRDAPLSLMIPIPLPSSCRGSSVGECAVFEEVSRRVLAGGMGDYMNYAALRADSVPCSQRGASYSNCRPGAQAHPYSRGCSTITHCRSS
ncbi:rapid alkalinization factor-like [Ananas comosus]|uniref:Rapid alkalinization factor n=1 Tax=Ananas comosus TaxID=4615 RepID=A0A199W615_ANACO|nr:rapid alkalinization factor-like [Ananas comosus]XP_020084929.1 rapid alkalinization factor-like [Ananas comosus]OAY84686.1 Rapid alkalinization factor [Ananas comosus]